MFYRKGKVMRNGLVTLAEALVLSVSVPSLLAWDHPGHMTTAAIAFAEIERTRPDLIETIGVLMLKHPEPVAFWVAAGDAKGKERARRMFIEAARWPDDVKWTLSDRPTWHMARWPVMATNAPSVAREAAEARKGEPAGEAIEALILNFGVMANPESTAADKVRALCWVMHIVGDIHQPLHVSDLFSKDFPSGNAGGTLSYVADPRGGTTVPLHVLWDSNTLVSTAPGEIDRNGRELMEKYPRSSFPELVAFGGPDDFRKWARESHKVALDWAFGIETVSDPNKDIDVDRLVQNMVKFILDGISPVEEAPPVPVDYWEKTQDTAHRRITLAGYRIADLVIAAADRITAQGKYMGR